MKQLVTKSIAMALGVAFVAPMLMAPAAYNGSLGNFSGATNGGQNASSWGIPPNNAAQNGAGQQSGKSGDGRAQNSNGQNSTQSDGGQRGPGEQSGKSDGSRQNDSGQDSSKSDGSRQNDSGQDSGKSDGSRQNDSGQDSGKDGGSRQNDSGQDSGKGEGSAEGEGPKSESGDRPNNQNDGNGNGNGNGNGSGSGSGSSSSGGSGSGGLYPPLDPSDGQYDPSNSNGNDQQVPSSCAEEGSTCAQCVQRYEDSIQFNRRYLHVAWSTTHDTLKMTKKALAFGDSVSGIHATQGLAWQLAGRPQIEEAVASLNKTYSRKYHQYLDLIDNSLHGMAQCEQDNFAIRDLYSRFGFLYLEFIKARYESPE